MEIPEGWQRLPLGDLFEFKNGYNTDKSAYGSGTPFVNVMEVFSTDKLVVEDIAGTVTASQEHLELFSVVYGDVLFNRTSETPEDIAMATTYMADDKAIFGGFVIRGRQITKSLLAEYCVYCFQSSSIRKAMISRGQGAIRSNIGQKDLNKVALLFPPLPEQRRIAEILGTWDRAIAVTEALIAQSEAQKKALMQQLLTGKRRLPGFEGEWKEVRLGDIGTTYGGLTGKTKADFGKGAGYVPYKNVFGNLAVDISDLEHVEIKSGERQNRVQYGDILFTTSSETPDEVGMSSVVTGDVGVVYLNSFCFGFRQKDLDTIQPEFAKFYFRGEDARREISRLAQGSTRYNLSKREFLKIEFRIPPANEQLAIAGMLSSVETAERKVRANLQKLKTEKAALMQQLLTGKRRVKLTEAAA